MKDLTLIQTQELAEIILDRPEKHTDSTSALEFHSLKNHIIEVKLQEFLQSGGDVSSLSNAIKTHQKQRLASQDAVATKVRNEKVQLNPILDVFENFRNSLNANALRKSLDQNTRTLMVNHAGRISVRETQKV